MMRLVYSRGGRPVVFECVSGSTTVGRRGAKGAVDLDLTPDQKVSRPHAHIWTEDDQWWIEDLQSARGTRVGDEEIKGRGRRRLRHGDRIRVGDTTLQVELPEPVIEQAEPPASTADAVSSAIHVSHIVDAAAAPFRAAQAATHDSARQLAFLYELPLLCGADERLDAVLQRVVARLVDLLPGASRGGLLLTNPGTGELFLKAHVPIGHPSVSLTLARRAIDLRQGFVWNRDDDLTLTQRLRDESTAGMYTPLLYKDEVLGVLCVDNGDTWQPFTTDDLRLLVAAAHHLAMAVIQHRLDEQLRQNAVLLERLLTNFSPKIRTKLLEKARHGRLRLGGDQSEVTILSADIRGFTRTCEGMDAEDVVDLLNDYFGMLVDRLFAHDGTIDKFVGDAVLAVFGSPEPDPRQHENAIRAALDIQRALVDVNSVRRARGRKICELGIGVTCGVVLHGFVGSEHLMEFTVIGDAVNKATRYCDGAVGTEVLISPELHQRVWRLVDAEATSIGAKHDGTLEAFRVTRLRD